MKPNPRSDFGLLILRIGLGIIMLFYGSQKVFGRFGGQGYAATVEMFTKGMHLNPILAHLAIAGEFMGGLGVLVGGLTPVAAFGVAATMAVATYVNATEADAIKHLLTSGEPSDASHIFYTVILFFAAVSIMIQGAGRYSLDARLFRGKRGKR